ncbi:hypothetical protein [Methylobacterium planeticum]|uniref:hypothetical protein n=1 Tax=Methylobacterium planeticum TaxID=2615211 RepID=UPI00177F75F7|nr:hypothetical protein [Methylobacterium planeticum]
MQIIHRPHSNDAVMGLLGAALLVTVATFTVSGALRLHDLGAREIAGSLRTLNAD